MTPRSLAFTLIRLFAVGLFLYGAYGFCGSVLLIKHDDPGMAYGVSQVFGWFLGKAIPAVVLYVAASWLASVVVWKVRESRD